VPLNERLNDDELKQVPDHGDVEHEYFTTIEAAHNMEEDLFGSIDFNDLGYIDNYFESSRSFFCTARVFFHPQQWFKCHVGPSSSEGLQLVLVCIFNF